MIRALFIFVLLLASVYLGVQLSQNPGHVLITFSQWTIETTLWVAVFSILLCFLTLYSLIHILTYLFNLPSRWRGWLEKRHIQKAQSMTRKGLIEYSEGHWKSAKKHLIKALPDTDTPLLNYLTAARASQKMGNYQLRDHYLREAQQSMPEAKIAVELTQAELQLANHQWEQALATLKHLQDLSPNHPYVLKLLMNLYEEVKDWSQLIALLPDLKKHQIISAPKFETLRLNAYYHSIKDHIRYAQIQSLSHLMDELPKSLINDPLLNAEYCAFLISADQHEEAETILRRCLRKEMDDRLISLYGRCHSNIKQQLSFAESLIKKAPHSASLYLCLGQLSMVIQLWGKAKNYLEKSIELQPRPESYQALGQLHEQLNEPLKASDCYKKGLQLISKASQ